MTTKPGRGVGAICLLALSAAAMGCGESAADGNEKVAAVLPGQLPVAFQGLNHSIFFDRNGVCTTTGLPAMASGTVPSMVTLPGGGTELAWQGSNGHYFDDVVGQPATDTGRLMQGGTSPSIAGCPTCVIPAFGFHGSNGNLWVGVAGARSSFDTGGAMQNGTSPSVALFSNGTLALAFNGANGHLWVGLNGWNSGQDTGGVMKGGTSPSIAVAGPNNRVAIAFRGTNQHLWYGDGPFNCHDQNVFMLGSPSVAVSSDGSTVYVAFQTLSLGLWVENVVTGSFTDTTITMSNPSPTPSIIATADGGYQVAAKGTNGHLWLFSSSQGVADEGSVCSMN